MSILEEAKKLIDWMNSQKTITSNADDPDKWVFVPDA